MPPYIERDANYDRRSRRSSVLIGGSVALLFIGVLLWEGARLGNGYAQVGLVVYIAILLAVGYIAATARISNTNVDYDDQKHCTDDSGSKRHGATRR